MVIVTRQAARGFVDGSAGELNSVVIYFCRFVAYLFSFTIRIVIVN